MSPYKSPRNLKTSEPSRTSFRVTWDAAPGDVRGYKVTFHPVGDEIDLGELRVGPHDNTVVLEELRCVFWESRFSQWLLINFTTALSFGISLAVLVCRAGTKYTVNVAGLFDGGESMPLAGEEHTTLSDEPDDPIEMPGMENSLLPLYHLQAIRVVYIFQMRQVSKHASFYSERFHSICWYNFDPPTLPPPLRTGPSGQNPSNIGVWTQPINFALGKCARKIHAS